MPGAKISRKEILTRLGAYLDAKDIIVAALAGTSNECFHTIHRPANLYLVGMSMVTPVAFGLARALPGRRIIALDTDGSQLLAPSILPVVASYAPKNLFILVFDNERLYGTRGGPASQTAGATDLAAIAKAAGILHEATVATAEVFVTEYARFLAEGGPSIIVCKVESTFVRGQGPTFNGQENKFRLIRFIEETKGVKILEASK